MGTSATVAIRNDDNTFTHVRVNWDGYPDHMLAALANVTDDAVLAAREIRSITPEGEIEAYDDASAPEILPTQSNSDVPYSYFRDAEGSWMVA